MDDHQEELSPRFFGEVINEEPSVLPISSNCDTSNLEEDHEKSEKLIKKYLNEFQSSLIEKHKEEKELNYYTMDEIKQHNNSQSLWMVLNGKVFDLTLYQNHHPGGIPKLLKGAGKDATSLFNKYHKWVNYNIMVGKLHIGYLKKDI